MNFINPILTSMVLACGVGGTSLGLLLAGFREILSVDNWAIAKTNFELNFKEGKYGHIPFLLADLMKVTGVELMRTALIEAGELALLAITAPCQGFSIASGKANPLDPRNAIFLRCIELASQIKPRVILFENVPGMFRPEMVSIMNEIKRRFKSQLSDYNIYAFKVNSLYFGCPTDRERVIIICVRKDILRRPNLSAMTPDISQHVISNVAPGIQQISFGQSKKIIRLPHEFMPTITATEGVMYFEDGEWHPLASNETYLKRFSTFPADFELQADLSQAMKCKLIGNAVPPMLMYYLATYIRCEILGYPPHNALPAHAA